MKGEPVRSDSADPVRVEDGMSATLTGTDPMPSANARVGLRFVWRQVALLAIAALLTATLRARPDWLSSPASAWIVLAYLGLFCAIVAPRRWALVAVLAFGLTSALWAVNEIKIAKTQMPLTTVDFQITLRNPQGLLEAVKLSWSALLAGVATVIGLIAIGWHLSTRWTRPAPRTHRIRRVAVTLAALAGFVFAVASMGRTYIAAVDRYALKTDAWWDPGAMASLSRRIGTLGFLAYSYTLEGRQTGDYYDHTIGDEPPSQEELIQVASRYVRPAALLPNIVVVQAESTFNVNDTFRLTRPVRNGLFEGNPATRALGSLYVNAVGGSSWRSEFESLVGIDERLFGYAGAYTHTSLSPFVKHTFVKYLKQRGYSTIAYYAVEGEFYNARSAYANYGFDRFLDSVDLKLPPGWNSSDDDFAQAVVARSPSQDSPLFQFLVTVQNHGPHWCDNTIPQRFVTRFADAATFSEDCVLNDFIRRARSTDAAIGRLRRYLSDLEHRTHRPYVLLVYGDHQPYTFTDPSFEVGHGYETHRKGDKRHTFFHLMSSIDGVVRCCRREALPLTAIPTMLSAYVARQLDDLYLPVNLFGYDRCGSDALAGVLADDWAEWTAAARARRCPAYEKVVAGYRAANVF
jgi:hypothetical protein